jgi:phosphatidylethanolamine-binding protein (PEBP) family uncharacterized protein
VAQRTGAERFLAPIAKAASARSTLALAAAAFFLAGCGGGSPDPEAAQTTGAGSTEAAKRPAGAAESPIEAEAKAPSGSKARSGESATAAAPEQQGGAGQKQGPRITQPKAPPEKAPTPEQVSNATVADMTLQSPAIVASGGSPGNLPATYTCDGKNSWPELRWSGVPAGTAELALFVMNVQPVAGKLFVDWAVAGLDPGLEGIEAGRLPKGAVVGANGFGKRGYEICPSGGGEIYMFAIYALSRRLSPPKGFDARELRKEVLDVSGNVGLLPAVYARG